MTILHTCWRDGRLYAWGEQETSGETLLAAAEDTEAFSPFDAGARRLGALLQQLLWEEPAGLGLAPFTLSLPSRRTAEGVCPVPSQPFLCGGGDGEGEPLSPDGTFLHPWRVTAAALPWLRRSEHAAVVNLASIAALNGLPQRALYSASKGAVLSLTFAMATDHIADGVRVNAVSPGTVFTPFVEKFLTQFEDPVKERAALDARQATGRMVTPEEVAGAIAYLASPASGSTTGTVLDVDGGLTHLRVRKS